MISRRTRDTFGFKLASDLLGKYAENSEPSTFGHRIGMYKCKYPEYKNLFDDVKRFVRKNR